MGGRGVIGIMFRGVIAGICLLPPTMLMGATLPAISRWVETTPEGVSWLGFFYGGNIAGAVVGSVLAGFYLLRVFDVPMATIRRGRDQRGRRARRAMRSARANVLRGGRNRSVARDVRAVASYARLRDHRACPGMTALAAEVIWTRLLVAAISARPSTRSR